MSNAATKIIEQKDRDTLLLVRLEQIKGSYIDNERNGDFPNTKSANELKQAIVRMVESNKVEAIDPKLIIQLLLDSHLEVIMTANPDRRKDHYHPEAVISLIEALKNLDIIGTAKNAGIEFIGSRANAMDGLV